MDAICKEGLWKKNVFAPKFLVYREEIKGSQTFFRFILSEKKTDRFPTKSIHQLSISDVKMLPLTGKIGKAHKGCNFLVYTMEDIPAIKRFFQTLSLACGQNSRMLSTFFRSKDANRRRKVWAFL